MNVMVIVKANADSEASAMPSEQLLTEMGNYNEELVKAGIMLDGNGLLSSAKGARVRFAGGNTTVINGPFSETKELIAGYWIWKVDSLHEAIDWVKKMPGFEKERSEEVEIRQVVKVEDFGEYYTDEVRAQEDRLREEVTRQNS